MSGAVTCDGNKRGEASFVRPRIVCAPSAAIPCTRLRHAKASCLPACKCLPPQAARTREQRTRREARASQGHRLPVSLSAGSGPCPLVLRRASAPAPLPSPTKLGVPTSPWHSRRSHLTLLGSERLHQNHVHDPERDPFGADLPGSPRSDLGWSELLLTRHRVSLLPQPLRIVPSPIPT